MPNARPLTPLALLLIGLAALAPAQAAMPGDSGAKAAWMDQSLPAAPMVGQLRDTQGSPLKEVPVRVAGPGFKGELRTDAQGRFKLPTLSPGAYRFTAQAPGFDFLDQTLHLGEKGWAQPLRFVMRPMAAATVEVVSGMVAKVQPQLREDIITTETVSALEIRKTNAVSLNEAVDCKPGISVQTECSICNVRNVVLNNLPGRFTTIMIDGVPIFSSVSGAYGLDMIGVNGVEAIEVSRGAGVSLIAPEALAGTVNVVSRRPDRAETTVEGQPGTLGYKRLEAFWARPFEGGALTASFLGNHHDSVDGNGNGVSEYTGYKRYLGGLGLFLDEFRGWKVRGRLDWVDEKRNGGAMGFDHDAIRADLSGNPFDWSQGRGGSPDGRGWIRPDGNFDQAAADGQNPIRLADGRVLIPYGGGRGRFSEIIATRRQQGILVMERGLGDTRRLRLSLGAAHHDQDSFYEGDYYRAQQFQSYFQADLQWFLADTLVTAGLNHRYEDLRSSGVLVNGTAVDGLDNYTYQTPAAFLQVYHAFLDGKLEINGSMRHDRNNVFGGLTTPRLNLLWHHTGEVSSRLAVGRGFRMPTSFFEQDHGILSTTRIDRVISRPETSDNASYTFAAAGEHCAVQASASYNRIHDYAMLDSGARDAATGRPITLFTQASDPVTVRGLDATFTWRIRKHLETTVGAETYRYQFTPGVLSFARPEERVYLRCDYDDEIWSLFARATWTGSMDLRRFYDYGGTPRFNLDGSSKLDRSPAYWVVDMGGSLKLGPRLTLTANVSNLFDFQQAQREDFLWVDAAGSPDVTHFWGPGRGRSIQVGLRFQF